MLRHMKYGGCGSVIISAFSCLILSVLLSVATVQAGQWDTTGAHQAFLKAEKGYDALTLQPNVSLSEYLECARAYRQVYSKDPHYVRAALSVYREGLVYQKMGEVFDKDSYRNLAVKRFNFLVSDYGGNELCPDALVRIGEIYSKKLNNPSEAEKAFQLLRSQYKHSSVKQPGSEAAPPTVAEAAPEQPTAAAPETKNIRTEKKSTVRNIRHWSSPDYTRLIIDMDSDAPYKDYLLHNPKRMYFDIINATLNKDLHNKSFSIQDKFIKRFRIAQNSPDVVRIVVDFSIFSACSVYKLQDPSRIVIDLHYHPNEQAKITKPRPVKPASSEKESAAHPGDPGKASHGCPAPLTGSILGEVCGSKISPAESRRENRVSRRIDPKRSPRFTRSRRTNKQWETHINAHAWIENWTDRAGSGAWRTRSWHGGPRGIA